MTNCIYRPHIVLNHDVPKNDGTATLEHVIPLALGGSNQLATNDACKKANNDLGSEIDAPFANLLPLAIKRHQLQICGQSGDIPPIVWKASTPSGAPARVTLHADGSADFELPPDVQSKTANIRAAGEKDRMIPIIEGIVRGARKRGETLHSTSGAILNSLGDCLAAAEVELVDRLKCSVTFFDHEIWVRGLMKIALGIGHIVLGPTWTFGSDGQLIREYVVNPRSRWPKKQPRGFAVGEWPRSIRIPLGKTKEVRDSMFHTVAIAPNGEGKELFVAISLFGGLGVPEAFFSIGREQGRLTPYADMLPAHQPIGYRIDPRTRRVQTITLRDADRRVAYLG